MNPREEQVAKAAVLIEALPYMQSFRGETFLIKVGGSAMDDPALVRSLLRDIVFMEAVGINPVVVHGGGKAISKAMTESGLEANFIGGLRVTDGPTIEIVEKTLSGVINPGLVESIVKYGGKAVGVPGTDVFIGEKTAGTNPDTGEPVDLGYVGRVVGFNLDPVDDAIGSDVVPVLSPLASEMGTGQPLNVNADVAASALAGKIDAAKLIFVSDVLGVMRDPAVPESLLNTLTSAETETLISEEVISGGMIPKVRSATEALEAGVEKVHLIDGRIPHSLLLEVFTEGGIGTQII